MGEIKRFPLLMRKSVIGKCCVFVFIIFMFQTIGSKTFALEQKNRQIENTNIFLGFKILEEDDWKPIDEHVSFGLDTDYRGVNWPVSIVLKCLWSLDDYTIGGIKARGDTTEVSIGIRKTFEDEKFPQANPFIGGGLSFIFAERGVTILGVEILDNDYSIGTWFGGGLYFTLAKHFNIGANIKYSWAEVTLSDVDVEAGGLHYGALIGYRW